MDIEALFKSADISRQMTAKQYGHMTLGKLIEALKGMPQDARIEAHGVGVNIHPRSYRGYYCDLSVGNAGEPTLVADAVNVLTEAIGKTYQGYKGGDFTMSEDTLVWLADYGDCGPAIMGATLTSPKIVELVVQDQD